MYCASCGMAVSPSLSYCNRCGAEVNVKERSSDKRSEAPQETLVFLLAAVTIFGIGVVIGLMAVMKEVVQFNNDLILGFTVLSFLVLMGIDGVITWLLLRPRRDAREYFRAQQKALTTNELAESTARVLSEPTFSVTDHTTHTLEAADRKRQTE